jgi:hypothetical protein
VLVELLEPLMLVLMLLAMEQIQFLVQLHQRGEVKVVKKLQTVVMVDLAAVQADQVHQAD